MNLWFIVIVVMFVVFMEVFDIMIVNVVLLYIVGMMLVSYDEVIWIFMLYFVVNGIVLLILGFFGCLFGCKCYFLLCIVVFIVCLFLCGVVINFGELIVFCVL